MIFDIEIDGAKPKAPSQTVAFWNHIPRCREPKAIDLPLRGKRRPHPGLGDLLLCSAGENHM
jgi:hypothetical protein